MRHCCVSEVVCCYCFFFFVFFFKQKTAYEMRISDWSSDVCSSDLWLPIREVTRQTGVNAVTLRAWERRYGLIVPQRTAKGHRLFSNEQIGRASCRERVCQYV